MTILSNTYTGF